MNTFETKGSMSGLVSLPETGLYLGFINDEFHLFNSAGFVGSRRRYVSHRASMSKIRQIELCGNKLYVRMFSSESIRFGYFDLSNLTSGETSAETELVKIICDENNRQDMGHQGVSWVQLDPLHFVAGGILFKAPEIQGRSSYFLRERSNVFWGGEVDGDAVCFVSDSSYGMYGNFCTFGPHNKKNEFGPQCYPLKESIPLQELSNSLIFSKDGVKHVCWSSNKYLKIWRPIEKRNRLVPVCNPRRPALSPDKKTIAVIAENSVLLIDVETLSVKSSFVVGRRPKSIAWSADGTTFAVGFYLGVTIFDIE